MDIYFVHCVMIQYYVINFIVLIDPALPTVNSFNLLLYIFIIPSPLHCFGFLSTFFFLGLYDALDSHMFLVPTLDSDIFSKSPLTEQ